MLTPDHHNARFLLDLYGAADTGDRELSPEERAELISSLAGRFSPDWVIHTGGQRHATIGDVSHGRESTARRQRLSGGTFEAKADWALADDTWGAIHSRVTAERDRRTLDVESLGMWRFAPDGTPVEHWELVSDPEAWDAFWDD